MKDPKRVFTFKEETLEEHVRKWGLVEDTRAAFEKAPVVGAESREFLTGISGQLVGEIAGALRVRMKNFCSKCGSDEVDFSTKRRDDGTVDGFLDCVKCRKRVKLSGLTVGRVDVVDFEPEGVVEVEEATDFQVEDGA
jgi:DNA-directed RNA polymerase subunit M/transcription elongation factor TFIIS